MPIPFKIVEFNISRGAKEKDEKSISEYRELSLHNSQSLLHVCFSLREISKKIPILFAEIYLDLSGNGGTKINTLSRSSSGKNNTQSCGTFGFSTPESDVIRG